MALDRITTKNFLSKPSPPGNVTIGWLNYVIDYLNGLFTNVDIENGDIIYNGTGYLPAPICLIAANNFKYFEDFFSSVASAAPLAEWTVTEDDAACTQLLIAAAGGVLQLTNKATTDDNAQQIQHQQEFVRLALGQELWFEARVRIPDADVTNIDFTIGLAQTEDLTGVADNMPANGIVFTKTDAGVGTVFLASCDNGSNIVSAASLHTMVTNTWTRLGFHWDGAATALGTITPYINGIPGAPIAGITYGTMTELAPIFMVRNGDATTTQILDIDYVLVVQER
jgi:hypothetical protein